MLIEALKELGEVVMSTGESTEDAAALTAASIGVAMGSGAVEVAKEASKIIAFDGDFRELVMAIVWGRAILENIRKFLCFQLTINGVACITTLVSALEHMGNDVLFPLMAIQLLWVNLIMDSLGALMLATEVPDDELMRLRPNDKAVPLVSPNIIKQVLWQGLTQLAFIHFLELSPVGAGLFFFLGVHFAGGTASDGFEGGGVKEGGGFF
jgi:Ca2+-transporting ATPase